MPDKERDDKKKEPTYRHDPVYRVWLGQQKRKKRKEAEE